MVALCVLGINAKGICTLAVHQIEICYKKLDLYIWRKRPLRYTRKVCLCRNPFCYGQGPPRFNSCAIHPFREGNGRAARVLSILMALQAGLPLLDFSSIAEERKQEYFAAVQAGLDKNYALMERLFAEIIERSLASM